MSLIKEHLIEAVHSNVGYSKSKSTKLIECLLEIIKKTLENGEDVLISGFGKFCVKEKSQRRGRNPATGNDMMLASRRILSFRCSPVLREKMDRKR